jgi:succinyl-diaminopimelate desuccinylase
MLLPCAVADMTLEATSHWRNRGRRGDSLLDETLTLVDIPSPSGAEGAAADYVERRLRGCGHLDVVRVRNSVVARTSKRRGCRLLLAGHVDTVRPADPPQVVRRDDDVVYGRGAVDMKGGVAVLLALADRVLGDATSDVTVVVYDREETGSHGSGMRLLAESYAELLHADAAVVLEPTGGWAELGCQGNLGVLATFEGRPAHTARPWQGVNAAHRAAAAIARCAEHRVKAETVEGFVYSQAFEIVGLQAGGAVNVVPDRCSLLVNARYAPSRDRDAVLAEVMELLAGADEIDVTVDSPAARPRVDAPLLRDLVAHPSVRTRPKLGWTDIGRLAQLGVPAVNFGPGDPELAHTADERVSGADLTFVHDRIAELVTS